jgi:hypothetical protein
MVTAYKRVLVIELNLVSFDEPTINDDEYEDDNDDEYVENSRIGRDEPYWEDVLEHNLFGEDNNLPGPSMAGAMLRRVVLKVMGRVMRVRMRMRIIMRRRMMIIKMQMQKELKKRVEWVNAMVVRLMMILQILTWHEVTFLYPLPLMTRRMRFHLLPHM